MSIDSKCATEFPTQKALADYLKKHPDADKSKHTVAQKPSESPSKMSDEALSKAHASLSKWVQYLPHSDSRWSYVAKQYNSLSKELQKRKLQPTKTGKQVFQATEFPTQNALDDYLVKHPGTERSEHTVAWKPSMNLTHMSDAALTKEHDDIYKMIKSMSKSDSRWPLLLRQYSWLAEELQGRMSQKEKAKKYGSQDEVLRSAILKLAHEVPETRSYLVPILRKTATPTYKDYVQKKREKGESPLDQKAWERKVLQTGPANQPDKDKGEIKSVKVPKDIGGIMSQYQSSGDIFHQVGSYAIAGKEIDSDKIEEAIEKTEEYLARAQEGKHGWGKVEVKELTKVMKGLKGLLPKKEEKPKGEPKTKSAPGALGSPSRLLQQWGDSSSRGKAVSSVGKVLEKGGIPDPEDAEKALAQIDEWLVKSTKTFQNGNPIFDAKEKKELQTMKKELEKHSKPKKEDPDTYADKLVGKIMKSLSKPVKAIVEKHDMNDSDLSEVGAFQAKAPKAKKSPAQMLADFMAKAKPETKKRMKGVTPEEFMKIFGAIMSSKGKSESE